MKLNNNFVSILK